MASRLLFLLSILALFNLSNFVLAQGPPAAASTHRCFFTAKDNVIEPPPENDDPVPRPTSCPDGSKPRDPPERKKLKKRTLILPDNFDNDPPGRANKFITQQITEARDQDNLVQHAGRDGQFNAMGGISSSKFFDFRNVRFNTGVENLHGCTSVIIVAKRGIWISHHWEIPGFMNIRMDGDQPVDGSETPVSDQEFKERILNFFRFGDSTGGQTDKVFPPFVSKTAPGEVFGVKSELLKVVVVGPRNRDGLDEQPGNLRFPDQTQTIIKELKDIFKDVQSDLEPVIADYNVLAPNDNAKEAKHGTVLVQFDPRQRPPGQDQTKAIVRIWVQGDQVDEDITWDPLPNQRKRDLFRRQETATIDDPCPEEGDDAVPTTLTTQPTVAPTHTPPVEDPNNYRIKLHQWMSGDDSSLEWTLLDSAGATAAGPTKDTSIPGQEDPRRNEIQIQVEQPTNKDQTRVFFTLNTDQLDDNCKPTWDNGKGDGSEPPSVNACSPVFDPFFGCDESKPEQWKPVDEGFERDFECRFMDIIFQQSITVPLGD